KRVRLSYQKRRVKILARINSKEYNIDYKNTIKKSNNLSMAKLNQGLTLNQMQLLAYAIFSTQKEGETSFRKHNLQKRFEIKHYKTTDAFEDSDKISGLRFSTQDLDNDKFSFVNVFSAIDYAFVSLEGKPLKHTFAI